MNWTNKRITELVDKINKLLNYADGSEIGHLRYLNLGHGNNFYVVTNSQGTLRRIHLYRRPKTKAEKIERLERALFSIRYHTKEECSTISIEDLLT